MKFHGVFMAIGLSCFSLAAASPAAPAQAAPAPAQAAPTPVKNAAAQAQPAAAVPTDFSPTPLNWIVTFPTTPDTSIPLNIKGILTTEGSWHVPFFMARLGRMIHTEQTWLSTNATTPSQKAALQSELNVLTTLATQVAKAYPDYSTSSKPLDGISFSYTSNNTNMLTTLHDAMITAAGAQMLQDTAFGQWSAQPNNSDFQQRSFSAQQALDYDMQVLDEFLTMAVRDGIVNITEFVYFNQSMWEDLQERAQDLNAVEKEMGISIGGTPQAQTPPRQQPVKPVVAAVKIPAPVAKKAPAAIRKPAPAAAKPKTPAAKPAIVKRDVASVVSTTPPTNAPAAQTPPPVQAAPPAASNDNSNDDLQTQREILATGFKQAVRNVFQVLYPSNEGPVNFITVDPTSGALPGYFYSVYGSTMWETL